MALIFSPLTEDVLEGPFEPRPRTVFVMAALGAGKSRIESDMDSLVFRILGQKHFKPFNATSLRGSKDYLEKIIQLIRGSGFAVAIFSEYTPAATLANIFFEVALCNLFGKPVLLVKSANAKPPSDFVRTEWVTYDDGSANNNFHKDFAASVNRVLELADYYSKLGDLAMSAEEGDLELAFERYKQAFLISGQKTLKKKIGVIMTRLQKNSKFENGHLASMRRFRKSVTEFHTLLA